MVAGAVSLFLGTVLTSLLLEKSAGPKHSPAFGLDFIAFYTGGTFVNEGHADQLFNLRAVQAFQRELAWQNGVKLGDALGPWWNPPYYAWVFAPLARLPFGPATAAWIGINVLCAAAAAWLLVRMLTQNCGAGFPACIPAEQAGKPSPQVTWRTWALIPVGILLSAPFIQSITHGQNTGTSLLLLTLIVAAWRANRGFLAGLLAGLLFYKPQLAAVLAAMMVLSIGWRALAGIAVSGIFLFAVTWSTMPGALGQFVHQMPANVDFVQTQCVYMWERHATFKAFWRLLIQGRAIGTMGWAATTLTALSVAGVALALVRISPLWYWLDPFAVGSDRAARRLIRASIDSDIQSDVVDRRSRDRLIAATTAATPLLVPFYFDYDLLLLAIPAVLVAAEWLRDDSGAERPVADRLLAGLWPMLYGWMLLNADIAERFRVNLSVPLLTGVASLLVARALRRDAVSEVREATSAAPLAAAA